MFIGDYLADTGHLTTLQHGIYHLLIYHYWRTGGLPDDDRQLASIARMSLKQWLQNKPTIQAFFHDGWKHKRISQERSRASAASDRRAAAGRLGGLEKARKNSGNATASATAMPPQCSATTPHHKEGESLLEETHKVRAKKKKTSLPADFSLTEALRKYGRAQGWSEQKIEYQFDRFCNSAVAHNRLYADWTAAWRMWTTSDYQKVNGNGHVNRTQHPANRAFELADELERAFECPVESTGDSQGGGEDAVGLLEWRRPA